MAINSYDIVSTLQALGMMKYWKGKHIILKKQVSRKRERRNYYYNIEMGDYIVNDEHLQPLSEYLFWRDVVHMYVKVEGL